jgi:hypothetical protein
MFRQLAVRSMRDCLHEEASSVMGADLPVLITFLVTVLPHRSNSHRNRVRAVCIALVEGSHVVGTASWTGMGMGGISVAVASMEVR